MDIRTRVEKAFERWKGSPPEIITRLPQSGSDRVYFRLICREEPRGKRSLRWFFKPLQIKGIAGAGDICLLSRR